MTNDFPKRLFTGWFVFCISLSLLCYLGDIIFGPSHALQTPGMLPMYFLIHFIVQIYIILPAIAVYHYLFRKIHESLLLKIIFLGMLMLYIAYFLRADDWNLTNGSKGNLKQELSYVLGAISMILFDELYLLPKRSGKTKP